MQTADAGCHDYTDAVLVEPLAVEGRVIDCLLGRYYRILCVEVELTGFLTIEVIVGIEVLNLAGKLCLELRGVKMCNRAGSTHSVNGILPRGVHVIAKRIEGSESCYDNSL